MESVDSWLIYHTGKVDSAGRIMFVALVVGNYITLTMGFNAFYKWNHKVRKMSEVCFYKIDNMN